LLRSKGKLPDVYPSGRVGNKRGLGAWRHPRRIGRRLRELAQPRTYQPRASRARTSLWRGSAGAAVVHHAGRVEVDELLRRWGGVATRAQLLGRLSRSEVDRALVDGSVLRVGHGRYGLPHLTSDLATAHRLSAVLSHESAALHHGWPVL